MPYRRRYSRRRTSGRNRYTRRRPYRRRRYSPSKTSRFVRRLRDAVSVEYKYHQVVGSGISVINGGTMIGLNSMSQGTTDTTRIGDSAKNQSLYMHYRFRANDAQSQTARIILFWDKQNIAINADDYLNSSEVSTSVAPMTFKDRDNRFRYRTLYDSGPLAVVDSTSSQYINRTVKLSINLHTQFDAASTTIQTGRLWMLVIGSQPSASNNCTFDYVSRLTFTDS